MKSNNLKQNITKGKKLLIDEMFYSIQTEGPLAGRPAYFIRLFGCNLDCSFCDTPQSKGKEIKIKKIVKTVLAESSSYLSVISGGEPFLQNINPLIEGLLRAGLSVQIETNGTLDIPEGDRIKLYKSPNVFIVVSPKTKDVHENISDNALAFKYVLSASNMGKDGLPKGLYRPSDKTKIMVSPMFTDNKRETEENFKAAIYVCKNYGYYLSLQSHKWNLINIK